MLCSSGALNRYQALSSPKYPGYWHKCNSMQAAAAAAAEDRRRVLAVKRIAPTAAQQQAHFCSNNKLNELNKPYNHTCSNLPMLTHSANVNRQPMSNNTKQSVYPKCTFDILTRKNKEFESRNCQAPAPPPLQRDIYPSCDAQSMRSIPSQLKFQQYHQHQQQLPLKQCMSQRNCLLRQLPVTTAGQNASQNALVVYNNNTNNSNNNQCRQLSNNQLNRLPSSPHLNVMPVARLDSNRLEKGKSPHMINETDLLSMKMLSSASSSSPFGILKRFFNFNMNKQIAKTFV